MEQPSGVYVMAVVADGTREPVDALELTDDSFRRFVLRALVDNKLVAAIKDEATKRVPLVRR